MIGTMMLTLLGGLWALTLHVSSGGGFPRPLSPREEEECLRQIKKGSIAARNRLVEHNLRLVAHIVKKYYAAPGEQEDLISIGSVGLIKAAGTFDPDKKTRFATYAARCIENEILMYFRSRKKAAGDLSLDDPIDTDRDGNSLTLLDLMSEEEDVVGRLDLALAAEKLRTALGVSLDAREQEVIRLRYGLGNRLPLTQREVAARLGISRSYVSRIESRALLRLREAMDQPPLQTVCEQSKKNPRFP